MHLQSCQRHSQHLALGQNRVASYSLDKRGTTKQKDVRCSMAVQVWSKSCEPMDIEVTSEAYLSALKQPK